MSAIFFSEFINVYCGPIQTDGVRENRNPADYKIVCISSNK
jgi:hypothetical protein